MSGPPVETQYISTGLRHNKGHIPVETQSLQTETLVETQGKPTETQAKE